MKYLITVVLLSASALACSKGHRDLPHMAYNHAAKPAYHYAAKPSFKVLKFTAKQAHKVSKFVVGL